MLLSIEQSRKFFKKIIFYGDHEAISQICNICKFDKVYDDIEILNEKKYPSYFYTLSKVIACQKTKEPFVHIENDFYLWDVPSKSKFFSSELIVEDMHSIPNEYQEEVDRMLDNEIIVRPQWKGFSKNKQFKIPTKGIYGGNNYEYINNHALEILRMIGNEENLNIFRKESSRKFYINAHRVCDSWYLGAKLNQDKKKIFNVRNSELSYTHLYSEKKNDPNISLKLYRRVKQSVPDFISKVNEPLYNIYDPTEDFNFSIDQPRNIPNIEGDLKKITFAISVLNRTEQIEETLPKNLEDNFIDRDRVEFVLVDFGSNDGFRDWIRFQNFKKYIESGYFKYYETDKMKSWRASIAKNTAIHFATGEVVVTLDCDNYTGMRGGDFILSTFKKNNYDCIMHQFDWNSQGGNFGRIALTKNKFNELGGYDQTMLPMGYQDWDLIKRSQALGLKYVNDVNKQYNIAIKNAGGKKLSIANTSKKHKELGWNEMNRLNKLKSHLNIYSNKLIVNDGYYGIRKDVRQIF